jgi:Fe-Mn family superoxide dismutase
MTYSVRTFDLPELTGLSKEQIDVHLKLYEGYVKHTNFILEQIKALKDDGTEASVYTMNELRRRLGFEFDGMRMHEYYFEQFEGGAQAADANGPFADAATESFGSWDALMTAIRGAAGTRGIGWVVVYFDPKGRGLHVCWVDDHQLGQLSGLPVMLAIDLWEHAFMVDYKPADKKSYVDAFFHNLNWSVVERRFLDEAV